MTLLETQRLVRKISEIMGEPGSNPGNPKMAEDFADMCRAVNLRLEKCEAMIQVGDRHQAIQLAEAHPNLLDCITALEFRDADQWRRYCEKQGLMVGEKIDARAVQALNECYSAGISTDHPLYAVYRRAVLSRNDEEALKALQSITRLNPTDTNAAEEFNRFDAKVLQTKLRHLDDLLAGSTPEAIVAEIESIEAFGFKNRPDGDAWRSAQLVRCGYLLNAAEKLQAASNWSDALSNVELIERLRNEFKLDLDPKSGRRFDTVRGWAQAQKERHQRERDFQVLLGEMHFRIQQSEEKDTSARLVKLAEMKNDYEGLHKVWRSLQDFTRPIPEDATAAFRKRSGLLEAEITRRMTNRRRVMVAAVAVVLVLGSAGSWVALARVKARDITRLLNEAVSKREVRTAEKLLEDVRSRKSLPTTAQLTAAATTAEVFVAKETALLRTFRDAVARLPKDFNENPSPSELATLGDGIGGARSALEALAPDLKTECEPVLQPIELRWQKRLAQSSDTMNAAFEQWLVRAEKQSEELDYRSPAEQVRPVMLSLSNEVSQLFNCESSFSNKLTFRSDLLQRSAVVERKFAAYNSELEKIDAGLVALRRAKAMSEYRQAIDQVASSEFSSSPAVKAAAAVQAMNPAEETALRVLLRATNMATWAFVKKPGNSRFIPESVFPAESAIFAQLARDPAVSGRHQRLRLWLDADGTRFKEWITAGELTDTVGWTTIKAYEPYTSPNSCRFLDQEYGYFDGAYKLSPTEPIAKIQRLAAPQETALYHTLGLEDFPAASVYTNSLLQVLDSVRASREGSPLFRAYLFLRLVEVMELQPESWGLSFAPSIQAHRGQIRHITGDSLSSGDWFVTAKVSAFSKKLDEFFGSVSSLSYAKQAAGLFELERRAAAGGLKYAGYTDLDGQPVTITSLGDGELWGYEIKTKQPSLVGVRKGPKLSLLHASVPLAPVFMLTGDCDQILASAGIKLEASEFSGTLPVLFSSRLDLRGQQ